MKINIKHLEKIATSVLDFETMENQKSDEKDFTNVSKWEIMTILVKAYKLGYDDALDKV